MNRTPLAALLVALVIFAGCSATPNTNATARSDTTTAQYTGTPAESRTAAQPSATPAQPKGYPPGVNETRLVNATRLVSAHRAAIREQSFAFRWDASMQFTFGNHTVYSNVTTVGEASQNISQFHFHRTKQRFDGNQSETIIRERWANRTAVYLQVERDNRMEYVEVPRSTANQMAVESLVTGSMIVLDVLRQGEYAVADVTSRDGVRFVTIQATDYTGGDAENVSRFESTLVVDERGLVHSLNFTLVAAVGADSRLQSMHYGYELTRVGNVAVERPAWVANATTEQNP